MSQEEVDAANRLIIDSITKYKVIIAGCRDFTDDELLREKCDYHLQNLRLEDIDIRQTGKPTEEQPDQSEMLRWLTWLTLS